MYDYKDARILSERYGLKFDERLIAVADPMFAESELTQEQVDDMIYLWIKLICWLFDRKSYRWWQRIGLALYFLGFGKRIKGDGK